MTEREHHPLCTPPCMCTPPPPRAVCICGVGAGEAQVCPVHARELPTVAVVRDGRCVLLHRWSPWEKRKARLRSEPHQAEIDAQDRRCTRCGRYQRVAL